MHLDRGGAVLQVVGHLLGGRGKLSGLADWDKAHSEPLCHGGSQDESTRLDPDDYVDGGLSVRCQPRSCQAVDRAAERVRIAQQRRDVLEQDARRGPVRYVPDVVGEVQFSRPSSLFALASRSSRAMVSSALSLLASGTSGAEFCSSIVRTTARRT